MQPGAIPLQTSPFLRSYPAELTSIQRSRRDKIAKALPVIRQPPFQMQPGLAMEREARDYSDAFALSGYLLRFSALAICKNSGN